MKKYYKYARYACKNRAPSGVYVRVATKLGIPETTLHARIYQGKEIEINMIIEELEVMQAEELAHAFNLISLRYNNTIAHINTYRNIYVRETRKYKWRDNEKDN